MKRGDIYDARLNPTEGSEQAGTRPVVIVSRNAINRYSPVVVIVPLTDVPPMSSAATQAMLFSANLKAD